MSGIRRTEDHKYLDESGKEYPSVTKIIGWAFDGGKSDRLVAWSTKETCNYITERLKEFGEYPPIENIVEDARKEATRKKEEAGDIGTRVHGYIEEWANPDQGFEMPPFEDDEVKQAFSAFMDWAKSVDLTPIETEILVHDKRLEYAGTFDMLAFIVINGKRQLYLIDFKTSNYFYDVPMGCQLAAYRKAYGHRHKEYGRIEGIGIVRLDKETGKPHFRDYSDREAEYYDTFVMFRKIYKTWKESKCTRKRGRGSKASPKSVQATSNPT